MVADDDEVLRRLVTHVLNREGYQVVIAGSGEEVLAEVRSRRPDAIILDINMPQVLEAYGEIDHHCRKVGRPMGENDVWIAATARAFGVCLLSTDRDFDHLDGLWIERIWIDPQMGKTP